KKTKPLKWHHLNRNSWHHPTEMTGTNQTVISKTDLLILDDFGIVRLEQQQRLDLMEIFEDRHGRKATIIASQLPVASWYDIIGEDTIADAILDRIVHVSHRIELKGESLRKKR
ncbi:ATP-binding protein, partial [Sphingobacterium paucimobilis]|uniref:ATP-binding protein n=1 Tax=Sphingobacterium paucimobilis TaxID=1385985 RepID=UPI0004CF7E86